MKPKWQPHFTAKCTSTQKVHLEILSSVGLETKSTSERLQKPEAVFLCIILMVDSQCMEPSNITGTLHTTANQKISALFAPHSVSSVETNNYLQTSFWRL